MRQDPTQLLLEARNRKVREAWDNRPCRIDEVKEGPDGQIGIRVVLGGMNRPPFEKSAAIDVLFRHAQAIARGIGFDLQHTEMTGGGSDGNFTAALGIPTLDGLGADGKGAHAAHEQIYYSSLFPRTYLCARLFETLE